MMNKIKYIIIPFLLFTLSCQLSNDLMDGMDEYNTDPMLSVTILPASDAYYNNDKLTLTCSPSETKFTVKYTTDGSDPSRSSGIQYTAPVTIDTASGFAAGTVYQIRAVAYDENRISGIVNTFVTIGDGLTVTTPFEIATPAHLENMSLKVNDGTHSNRYFKQIADVDLSTYNTGGGWVPIGIAAHPFSGNYDGGIYVSGTYSGSNYSIDNMTIDRASSDNQGLFGYVAGNSILLHISLSNADVTGSNNTGALAGYINGTGVTISFCHVTGSVTATVVSSANIGGLAGYNTAEIYGSTSACAVTGLTSTNVGGFVGQNSGLNAQIYSNIATGEVKGGDYTGGFIGINTSGGVIDTWNSARGNVTGGDNTGGFLGSNDSSGVINQNNDARGDVIGADNVGGFVGYNNSTVGTDNYAIGNVNGTNNVGGFVGYNITAITSCWYTTGTVTGTGTYAAGFAGVNTSATGIITNCYSSGNVNGINSVGGFAGNNLSGGKIYFSSAKGNVSGSTIVGGFVATNGPGSAEIRNCYARGIVNCAGATSAGLVASNIGSLIQSCYSTGSVTSVTGQGCIASDSFGTIASTYWNMDTSGKASSAGGGLGRSDALMQIDTTYVGFTFTTDWLINPLLNGGYPYLVWESL